MGIYYAVACDELKERIDPGSINDLGVKRHAIAHPQHPFGSLVIFALVSRWHGKTARITDDCGDDKAYFEYSDVTQRVIAEYNSLYETSLIFSGE